LKQLKTIEKQGSSILENENFTIKLIPHYSIQVESSPEQSEIIATIPIGVALTGGNVKVFVDGEEILVTVHKGCDDGYSSKLSDDTTLKIVYEDDKHFKREGNDLIGTIIYTQKDSGKLTNLPYPTEIDDLPPLHIVEGRYIFDGSVDVVVTDGFNGNIAIKTTEGVGLMVKKMLTEELTRNIYTKFISALLYPAIKRFKKRMDYTEYGGGILLGIEKPIIKCHGGAKEKLFVTTIMQAENYAKSGAIEEIKKEIENNL
jgi:hypothetical protein